MRDVGGSCTVPGWQNRSTERRSSGFSCISTIGIVDSCVGAPWLCGRESIVSKKGDACMRKTLWVLKSTMSASLERKIMSPDRSLNGASATREVALASVPWALSMTITESSGER